MKLAKTLEKIFNTSSLEQPNIKHSLLCFIYISSDLQISSVSSSFLLIHLLWKKLKLMTQGKETLMTHLNYTPPNSAESTVAHNCHTDTWAVQSH